MNPARSVDEVRAIFAGRVRVSMVDAARAVGFSRPRLATLLRASGVAPRATETGRVATADVLAALAWAPTHESVNAASKRVRLPVKSLWCALVRKGVIVPSPTRRGMRWYRVRPADVDAAVAADTRDREALAAARDVARTPRTCPNCPNPCRREALHCSPRCAGERKRTVDREAIAAEVDAGATWATVAARYGVHLQTIARIMRAHRATVAA